MTQTEKEAAILCRLEEMGVNPRKLIYQLTWEDVVSVMAETPGFEEAGSLPTEFLVQTLNAILQGLGSLEWYTNVYASLYEMRNQFVLSEQARIACLSDSVEQE